MEKMKNIVEFAKKNKKEIITVAAAGTVGILCGLVGYKIYISKNYGSLIKLINQYNNDTTGKSSTQMLTDFLDRTTDKLHPAIPCEGVEKRLCDMLSNDLLEAFVEAGVDPDTKVSGIIVGTLK